MSTEDVAMRLVELCKGSEWKKAVDDLYAKDIVSVEPRQVANMPAEMRGIDQVRGKNDWWEKNMEVHDSKVSGPFDTVKNDKIAHERFLPLAEE